MINFSLKHLYFQIAMINFFIVSLTSTPLIIHIALIFAYLFLMLWEYKINNKITIDVLLWNTLFICINIYKIYKLYQKKK